MLNEQDLKQLERLGISEIEFEKQIQNFKSGISSLPLIKAASVGDGISSYDADKEQELIKKYDRFKESIDVLKFVPASGAATRMFKALFQGIHEQESGKALNPDAQAFIDQIQEFPFYEELKGKVEENELSLDKLLDENRFAEVLEFVLDKSGLDYGSLPKALISFHKSENQVLKAIEEHYLELIDYANSEGDGRLHFTVSEEHMVLFEEICEELIKKYSDKIEVEIEFSIQSPSTNTVAVYDNNEPVRLKDGSIMFRPGGHGALLKNLNEVRAQLIFIKNIDNVAVSSLHEQNSHYKKLLAGRLLEMRENIHSLLNGLIHESGRKKASDIIFDRWGLRVTTEEEIKAVLDRPIRVCGMVRNTGALGGGPFWVREADGSRNVQIVESSQVDTSDPEQKEILETASHFNPVDIVCWVEDHSGVKFDLMKYRDDKTGFITMKSFEGKEIKAQELPGLWNGAMAGWITEFVEVPLHTFNPVKTVLDLLKEGHKA